MLFLHAISIQYTLRLLISLGLTVCFSITSAQVVSISELRVCHEKVKSDEDYAIDLLDRLDSEVKNNIKDGYYGVIEAMLAEHTCNPIKKLSFFNNGKARLEDAIKKDSESVELRYLRLGIQVNIPGFLGYNNSIDSDKSFVIENISKQKGGLGDLYHEIIQFLLELDSCSDQERKKLKEL